MNDIFIIAIRQSLSFSDFILGSDLVVPIKIEVRMICFKIKCVFSYCTF